MFYSLYNFLNKLKVIKFYTVTILPYSIGDIFEQIRYASYKAKKNKKNLIIVSPIIFRKFLKYNLANEYVTQWLFDKKTFKNQFFKYLAIFFINLEFFFSRSFVLFLKKFLKVKVSDQYMFPHIGLNFYDKVNDAPKILKPISNFEIDLYRSKMYEKKIYNILNKVKLLPDDEFVCLHLRDFKYRGDKHRRFHRNPSIENYYSSINYLLNKGYKVIRLGLTAEKSLPENKNIIDLPYLLSEDEIKLSQFFFIKNSLFFIGTESGPQYISWCFKKPTLITNLTRFFYLHSPNVNCRYIYKKFYDSMKKPLSVKEYLRMPWKYHTTTFEGNILFEENNESQILDATKEFLSCVKDNNWHLSEKQSNFRDEIIKIGIEHYYNNKSNSCLKNRFDCTRSVQNILSNVGSACNFIL